MRLAHWSLFVLASTTSAQTFFGEISDASSSMGGGHDFDADSLGDVYVGPRVYSLADSSVLIDASGLFSQGTPFRTSAVVSDWNGNGTPDLIAGGNISQYHVLEGSTGMVLETFTFGLNEFVLRIINSGNVLGDSRDDLLMIGAAGFGAGGVFQTHTGGGSSPNSCFFLGGSIFSPTGLGDLNGDGFDDWAMIQDQGNFGVEYDLDVRTGTGGTLIHKIPDVGLQAAVSGVGDLDLDGHTDLLYSSVALGHTRVLSGMDLSTVLLDLPYFDFLAGPGDVDCDGVPELLVGRTKENHPGGLVELRSGVDGSVLWSVSGQPGQELDGAAAAGDLNGDGSADWLVRGEDFTHIYLGNPPATLTYCTGKVTSAGCTPFIDTSGTPTATGTDDFLLLTRDALAQKSGLLFFGTTGPASAPFLGGTLCVLPPLTRTAIQVSNGAIDCEAGYAFHFDQAFAASQGVTPGMALNGQYWMRDPAAADGTGVALTDGVEWTWGP